MLQNAILISSVQVSHKRGANAFNDYASPGVIERQGCIPQLSPAAHAPRSLQQATPATMLGQILGLTDHPICPPVQVKLLPQSAAVATESYSVEQLRSDKTASGYIGVYQNGSCWRAQVSMKTPTGQRQTKYLGNFNDRYFDRLGYVITSIVAD